MRRLLAVAALTVLVPACTGDAVHIVRSEKIDDLYDRPVLQGNIRVTLYMYEGRRLVTVSRVGRSSRPLAELAVRALLTGPTAGERSEGVSTSIPASVELTGVSVSDRVARVDLDQTFASATTAQLIRRCAQLVFTLTELDDVDSVLFYTDGRLLPVPDQDDRSHSEPVAAARYSSLAPINPLAAPKWTAPLRIDIRGEDESASP